MNKLILLLISTTIFSGCSDNSPKQLDNNIETNQINEWNMRVDSGMIVFENNCQKCHTPPHRKVRDGTNWTGLFDRLPNGEKYLIKFISSSSTLRANSDSYAIKIKEEFGNYQFEHEFADTLSFNEIKDLSVYLKENIK